MVIGYPKDIVRPHKFADGQDAMGTPAANEHRENKTGYLAGRKQNAELRGSPHGGTNPTVHSKATERYGRDGSRLDSPHGSTGQQPAVLQGRQMSSGIHSRDAHAPGKPVHQTVGHAVDGSGRWTDPSYPNASKGRQSPEHIHRPGTQSRPSGRTSTK
jgi:hypothetical protein